MLCLMNITSSFSSVYELLINISATPRSQYGIRDIPKGLVVIKKNFILMINLVSIKQIYC